MEQFMEAFPHKVATRLRWFTFDVPPLLLLLIFFICSSSDLHLIFHVVSVFLSTFTSFHRPVDDDVLVVHALDLRAHAPTLRWFRPLATDTTDFLAGPLRIAEADILRAQQRCAAEKARGQALGANLLKRP